MLVQCGAGLVGPRSELGAHVFEDLKERVEAAELRKAVLEGYDDVLHGRTREYTGDLRTMLEEFRAERGPA